MTREEAIKELLGYALQSYGYVSDAFETAIAALREREGKDTNAPTKWISVEDRLPTPYVEVLAYRKSFLREGGFVTMEHLFLWHDESLVWNNDYTTWRSKVTHWMPLPEPPEVEV